jgi:hypothetical protein
MNTINPVVYELFMKLGAEAPELFKQLLSWAVTFYDNRTKPTDIKPDSNVFKPINVIADDGSGAYTLVSKPVPESVRQSIRENFAHGIVYEEAAEWLAGFFTGLIISAV